MSENDITQHGPVLMGMRGSGKSTIAPLLAKLLGMKSLGADTEIVKRLGISIPDMFAQRGEQFFRSAEREIVLELLALRNHVVVLGGGVVLHPEVRSVLKQHLTVWLHAPIAVLACRIGGSDRLSLTGKPIQDELADVLAARKALYQEVASLQIDTGWKSPEEAAQIIAEAWKKYDSGGTKEPK